MARRGTAVGLVLLNVRSADKFPAQWAARRGQSQRLTVTPLQARVIGQLRRWNALADVLADARGRVGSQQYELALGIKGELVAVEGPCEDGLKHEEAVRAGVVARLLELVSALVGHDVGAGELGAIDHARQRTASELW